MTQKFISISKPCPVKWEGMTPTEGGRHCSVCVKRVRDFRGWKAEDILAEMATTDGEICGRLNSELVQRPMPLWVTRLSGYKYKWVGFIGATLVFIITSCRSKIVEIQGGIVACGKESLYFCDHKDSQTLDYAHKPNIHEEQYKDRDCFPANTTILKHSPDTTKRR